MTTNRETSTLINARKKEHSEKPAQIYELIEKCSLAPRLEMFARRRLAGWDAWGDGAPEETQERLA